MSIFRKWLPTNYSAGKKRHCTKRTSKRRLRGETLETRKLLAADSFHNELFPEDVNEDGQVTALDALTILNQLRRQNAQAGRNTNADLDVEFRSNDPMAAGSQNGLKGGPGRKTDVNNDGVHSAQDALLVINRLRRGPAQNSPDAGPPTPMDGPPSQERPRGPQDDARRDRDDDLRQQQDSVLAWNDLFGELLVADEVNQNPGYASRSMAMLNLAIYDTMTLTQGNPQDTFYTYDFDSNSRGSMDTRAAIAGAASTVLSSLYPEQQSMIDEFVQSLRGRNGPSSDATQSFVWGQTVGQTILEVRADDGHDVDGQYNFSDTPGSFQADPLNLDVPVWGPTWSGVDPFVISSAADFAPESPPDLDSQQYADSYNEVKELGSIDSEIRTADQTEAGLFWAYDRAGMGTPMALFLDVLETIATDQGNTPEQNAALFAQASVAMADAGVAAWHTKFSEQFWRPVTAIHQGDNDGNPLTQGDANWTALGAPDGTDALVGFTPQFPTYISGHATFGGALFAAIREFYGTDDIAFELSSKELEVLLDDPDLQQAYGLDLQDSTRSFESLSQAMAENGRSRVYLGIHFDFDDVVGQEVGQAIAETVSTHFVVAGEQSGFSDETVGI
ncbi:MAG: dockerin type I domain-containing protein [Planctomycetota bacterium]